MTDPRRLPERSGAAREPLDDLPPDSGDGIDPGRRLIRVEAERGVSLAERLLGHLGRLAWRTPLHTLRLRGRHPLKLLGVPFDPVPGSPHAGDAILGGEIVHGGETAEIETLDFARLPGSPAFADHVAGFAWLRDLAAAAPREAGAPIAELMVRRWLAAHGAVSDAGWRPDLWGTRILSWTAHAPLILSSADLVYRSAVLNALARGARHLDGAADRAGPGLPRIVAWAGVIAAGLLVPGGELRLAHGEAGMARALAQGLYPDGGLTSRSPLGQVELVETLAMLAQCYDVRGRVPADTIVQALARAVPALLGVTLGDGGLSSWQGSGPVPAARVAAAVAASGVRARPLRQARDWGYQRLACGATALVLDAAPPPIARLAAGGCASTLAFELSDGVHRLIVNCGGARGLAPLPPALADGLRTTAAHSTLTLADSNSTAIHADGSLGKGVVEVELDRQEAEGGSRLEVSHDGYARRYGLTHRRQLLLAGDGRELRGEDTLLPARRGGRPRDAAFALRFHVAPGVETSLTADGMGALLRIVHGPLWQFRCRGGTLSIEDSLWIDPAGRPRATTQLVVTGEAAAGGTALGWLLRRAG